MWKGMRSLKHPMNNQDIVKSRIRQEWESFTNHTLLWLLYLKQKHLGFLTWAELGGLLEFWMEL